MINKICQIAIGQPPSHIQSMMDGWQSYCLNKGIEYVLLSTVPDVYKKHHPRIASNYMRVDWLINNPDGLYIDSDIKILDDNLIIPEDFFLIQSCFDSFLSGSSVKWQEVRNLMVKLLQQVRISMCKGK